MSDPIVRLNAALEDRYVIERELGEGGMAAVYLAKDLRHNRGVALKVLKPELAAVVGAERFLAEIETTASLQHPNILPLFDSGEADGLLFYVMPYVEGESLRDRLDRDKQLSVDEAVGIATEVADALQAAHDQGVVHRDIKPANILLSRGRPLVADFGISLALSAAGRGRLTETGLSLGTPHYMSPEQATGEQHVGPSTDIYALGSVLYEMLVGQPPYTGGSAQAVLGKIISSKPPSATEERPSVPGNVDAAIRCALEKLPADRFKSVLEFATALSDGHFRYREAVVGVGVAPAGRWNRLTVAFAALAAASTLAFAWALRRPGPPTHPVRASIAGFRFSSDVGRGFAISRDGSLIAAIGEVDESGVFIRRADEIEFREIPGTEGAEYPTFSPDGQWLAFRQGDEIKRVGVLGGPVLPVAPGDQPHWGAEDMIVYTVGFTIYGVAPVGGEPRLLLDETSHQATLPYLLPDGEAVLFQRGESRSLAELMLLEIGSGSVSDLGVVGTNPRYVATGHLLFGDADQALMAVSFHLGSHRVTGAPFTVLPGVEVRPDGQIRFDVSDTGTALYGVARATGGMRLVEVSLDGVEAPTPLGRGTFGHPRYSPNGRFISYEQDEQILVYDRETGANEQLTTEGVNRFPVWSSDGRYIYYVTAPPDLAGYEGFRRLADGSGEEERLYRRDGYVYPLWSRGDELLMGAWAGDDRGMDLLVMTASPDSVIFTDYLRADWNEMVGAISPDGRWVAYASDESGVVQGQVRSFPEAERQAGLGEGDLSRADGPVWAPDGTAIYYVDPNLGGMMRALVTPGQEFRAAEPQMLFEGRWARSATNFPSSNMDLHPNGETFVLITDPSGRVTPSESPETSVRLVVNWFTELKERVPN